MNQQLNNRIGKSPKSQRRGCLFLVLGSLLALGATLVFIFVVSRLTGFVIEKRHGGEAVYAVMTAVKPCYGAAMLLFYGMLAVWYMSPSKAEREAAKGRRQGLAPMLGERQAEEPISKRSLWLITGGLLAGVLLTGAICVSTYRLVTPDGIRTYFFAETASYEWKQVSAYTVDCDSDSGLSVTFTMRDGKKFEILHGVNSATEAFREGYSSVTEYAVDIDKKMDALQVPANVRHPELAERFYRESYPELWPHVATLIGYRNMDIRPDETLPETTVFEEVTE